jgi:hypothetical protein
MVCNGGGGCVDCNAGAACPAGQCEVGMISCATGTQQCVTSPAPLGMMCDDGDACTSNDQCDGKGNCSGTPFTPVPTYQGTSPTAEFPLGTVEGACIYQVKYCSTAWPEGQAPPAPGYSSQASNPAGCDYNGPPGDGSPSPPYYQENFCKSCNGDCTANCP